MVSMATHNPLLKNGDASTKVLISKQHLIYSLKKLKVKQVIILKLSPLQLVLNLFTS